MPLQAGFLEIKSPVANAEGAPSQVCQGRVLSADGGDGTDRTYFLWQTYVYMHISNRKGKTEPEILWKVLTAKIAIDAIVPMWSYSYCRVVGLLRHI